MSITMAMVALISALFPVHGLTEQNTSQSTTTDLCSTIDGSWYYYYPPDVDFPDDVMFGKITMDIADKTVNSGLANIQSVILNLGDMSVTLDEYEETWQCSSNKLAFEGLYDDGSEYSFSGVITLSNENKWVWDDGELGEYIFTYIPHYINLDLITEKELQVRTKRVLDFLTDRDGFNPIHKFLGNSN